MKKYPAKPCPSCQPAKETVGEFAERMKIKWHDATIQIKPDNAPVSASLPNKLMKDLHEALSFIDLLSAENKKLLEKKNEL